MKKVIFFTQEEGGWIQSALIGGSQKDLINKLFAVIPKRYNGASRTDKLNKPVVIKVNLLWHMRFEMDTNVLLDYRLTVASMWFPNNRILDCLLGDYRDTFQPRPLPKFIEKPYDYCATHLDINIYGGTNSQRAYHGKEFWKHWRNQGR